MIDAISSIAKGPFVLIHSYYDVQNFVFDEEGSLTGIIDWNGVTTCPRTLGYARYSGWITRDWDPLMYGWRPDAHNEEDSPKTLKKLRKLYHQIIKEELGEDEARMMVKSHPFEAIEIAARNPFAAGEVIRLLAHKCILKPLFKIWWIKNDDGEGPTSDIEAKKTKSRETKMELGKTEMKAKITIPTKAARATRRIPTSNRL